MTDQEKETAARRMAIADGNDPDRLTTLLPPYHLSGVARAYVYVPMQDDQIPIWRIYLRLLNAALGN